MYIKKQHAAKDEQLTDVHKYIKYAYNNKALHRYIISCKHVRRAWYINIELSNQTSYDTMII